MEQLNPPPLPSITLNLALCHTKVCVVCQHLAARGWEQQHKSRGQRGTTVRGKSECKRATFLGAHINSPVRTLLRLLLSRKPERTTDNTVTFLQEGLWKRAWSRAWRQLMTLRAADPQLMGFKCLYNQLKHDSAGFHFIHIIPSPPCQWKARWSFLVHKIVP